MTDLPVEQVLLESIAQVERLGISYAVMGGFAARAWGLPRPTFDADIAVAVDAAGLQRLLAALEAAGFDVPPEHRAGFLDTIGELEKVKVTRFVARHVWSTDLFIVRGAFLNSALSRAVSAMIGGKPVRVMTAEDLILLKLMAHRRKDLADIEDIISGCPTLDERYLRVWAAKLDVANRLAEFLPRG